MNLWALNFVLSSHTSVTSVDSLDCIRCFIISFKWSLYVCQFKFNCSIVEVMLQFTNLCVWRINTPIIPKWNLETILHSAWLNITQTSHNLYSSFFFSFQIEKWCAKITIYDIVQIHHMMDPIHHMMYPVHHMMDRGVHHMMDRVHHMMDGVHHMMDGVHHMMDTFFFIHHMMNPVHHMM